jgi:hypothetical protein
MMVDEGHRVAYRFDRSSPSDAVAQHLDKHRKRWRWLAVRSP